MSTELTERLIADCRILATDAEELVKATASQSVEKIAEARARMQQALAELKPRLANAEAVLKDQARAAAHATDEYVHRNPWVAAGVASGVGVLLGLLISRR